MEIYIEKERKKKNIVFRGNVEALFKKLNLTKTACIVIRNNHVLTEDEKLDNRDKIRILSTVSGG